MKKTKTCPKCGSTEIIQSAKVYQPPAHPSSHPDLARAFVPFNRDPSARIFKRPHRQEIHAWVCTNCGYIENYASDTKRLKQAYRMLRENT